jgi:small subunit ribosomal protein S1
VDEAVTVGQEVTCKVLSVDDEKESLRLSKKAVDVELAWDQVRDIFNNDKVVHVKVVEHVKGGLVADLGIRGFIPASQVDIVRVEDLSVYVKRVIPVKIKEIDESKKRAVLSHRAVLEELQQQQKSEFLQTLAIGNVFEGTVERIADFGVFVNIGPVDGLVHVSELSWEHVKKPSEVVEVGQQVKVKVIKLEPEKQKISLSIKELLSDPWEIAAKSFKEGQIVKGIVRRTAEIGAFIEISPGVDGLCHISELSYSHVKSTSEVVKPGQEVEAKLIMFDPIAKRAKLSIKETLEKPESAETVSAADAKDIEAATNNAQLTQNLGEQFAGLSKLLDEMNKPTKKGKK